MGGWQVGETEQPGQRGEQSETDNNGRGVIGVYEGGTEDWCAPTQSKCGFCRDAPLVCGHLDEQSTLETQHSSRVMVWSSRSWSENENEKEPRDRPTTYNLFQPRCRAVALTDEDLKDNTTSK